MQNKTAYTKLIRRDETGETTAALDMTEEEFQKFKRVPIDSIKEWRIEP